MGLPGSRRGAPGRGRRRGPAGPVEPVHAASSSRAASATAAALEAWFADPLDALHDPSLLPDIGVVLERLALARTRHERVLVFGDFDADGLTGLSILVLALARYGIDDRAVRPEPPRRGPRALARGA